MQGCGRRNLQLIAGRAPRFSAKNHLPLLLKLLACCFLWRPCQHRASLSFRSILMRLGLCLTACQNRNTSTSSEEVAQKLLVDVEGDSGLIPSKFLSLRCMRPVKNVKFREASKLAGFLYLKIWETWGLQIHFRSPWRAYHCFVTNMDWDEECLALRNKDCSRLFQSSC